MTDNRSSPALAALAMRERAAAMIETHVVETRFDGSRVVVPSPIAREDQHNRSLSKAIRALPTTFTDAELLAAAMKLPEVRALVEAVWEAQDGLSWALARDRDANPPYCEDPCPPLTRSLNAIRTAIAPFMKGAS